MEKNYPYQQSTQSRQFNDITNGVVTTYQRDPFKLNLRASLVNNSHTQKSSARSTSKDKSIVKGISKCQKNDTFTDSTYNSKYQSNSNETKSSYQTTFSSTANQFYKQDSKFNKTGEFTAHARSSITQSGYTRSLKVSRLIGTTQSLQINNLNERKSRFGPSVKNLGAQKQKLNIRESLGSLSKQIKNTLNGNILKSTLENKPVPAQNTKFQFQRNDLKQSLKLGFSGKQNNQTLTRYENNPSLLPNADKPCLIKPQQWDFKFIKHDKFRRQAKWNMNVEQSFTSRNPAERTRSQILTNFLGKSTVVSTMSPPESSLKFSSVIQPLTPKLRANRKFQTYNLEKEKKGFSSIEASAKNDSNSNYSTSRASTNYGQTKNSFLQYSSVVDSFSMPKEQDIKGRQSIKKQPTLDDFHLGSVKGQGSFGKFYPAIHKKSGMLVGIKQIKKQSLKYMLDQFIQELKIQSFIDHPNIVKLYGHFSTTQNFYMILEYMQEGSLFSFVKKSKKLKEQQASTKLKQICSAVQYLHENQILHRDIKPENIVITCDVCKICDFGWAVYSDTRRKTYCGTLDYVCPQILEGDSYDSCVDIWAIGVLAYQMIVGKAPFYNISRKQTMKKIMECDFQLPKQHSKKAKQFISKALNKNPDQRSSVAMLAKHEFLK